MPPRRTLGIWLLLPVGLLGLATIAQSHPTAPPPVTVARVSRVVLDPPVLPGLPAGLAVPSAPVTPVDPTEAYGDRPIGEMSDTVLLPPQRWELPAPARMRPLAQLSPDAARFLANRGGAATVGVMLPGDNVVYVSSPELAVPMASVAKLVIMLALFDRAEVQGRELTAEELALLEPMMVWSDNDSATLLWDDLGGSPGIEAYLERHEIRGIELDPFAWGDSRASGATIAWLVAGLGFGDLVNAEHRAMAVDLLARAATSQQWGVGSGADRASLDGGAIVGVKDGWYPVEAGWRAGSAGLIMPGPGRPTATVPYAIAVLTAENAELEDGIDTINGLSERIQAALTPRGAG